MVQPPHVAPPPPPHVVADEWALRVLRLDDVSFASQLVDLGDEFFKVWACQSKVRPNVSPEQIQSDNFGIVRTRNSEKHMICDDTRAYPKFIQLCAWSWKLQLYKAVAFLLPEILRLQ